MTQPPTYPMPPAGGPSPAAGGFAPPSGPTPQGYAVPPQPGPYSGLPSYPAGPPGAPFRPGPPGVPFAPNGQPLASFGDRLLAVLIDGLVLGAVSLVIVLPAMFLFLAVLMPDPSATTPAGTYTQPDPFSDILLPLLAMEAGLILLLLAMSYVYQVEMMFRTGETVGKRVMKLRIVPLDPTATLDRKMAAKRWLAHQPAGMIIPGFSYVDGLWQLWDKPWQQCLHDKFARTVVVKVSG
ncbi:RDD family protein [Micromonospora purpureochromogenes]|uniref:RDD family protein n=1 Tax=Micromonospora purpureochromogenes TaxID=47872 RepID=UPI0033D9967E